MRLDGDGATPPELSALPASCAPSVRALGTPALPPGIDWPRVLPLADEPIVGAAAERPPAGPPPDELLCERAELRPYNRASALRLKRPADAQALLESQRSWILQRNSICGAMAGNAAWPCILDMTKKRIAALSDPQLVTVEATPKPQLNPAPLQPNAGASPRIQQTPTQSNAPKLNTPSSSVTSEGPNSLLVTLFKDKATAHLAFGIFRKARPPGWSPQSRGPQNAAD